jgi:hypothetical protein
MMPDIPICGCAQKLSRQVFIPVFLDKLPHPFLWLKNAEMPFTWPGFISASRMIICLMPCRGGHGPPCLCIQVINDAQIPVRLMVHAHPGTDGRVIQVHGFGPGPPGRSPDKPDILPLIQIQCLGIRRENAFAGL